MRWQSLAWAAVVVVVVAVELVHAVVGSTDVALRSLANTLRSSSATVDLIGLSARFALLQQYDGLVDAEKALENEIKAMSAIGPPAAVAAALASFQKSFSQRQADLLLLKAQRGVLTNTERYLPRLLDDLRKADAADPRVEEAMSLVLAWQMARDDDGGSLHSLQEFIEALKRAPADDPVVAAVPHLEVLISMRRALVDTTRERLIKSPLATTCDEVVNAVDVVVADHRARAQQSRILVLALAVLLVLATLWAGPAR